MQQQTDNWAKLKPSNSSTSMIMGYTEHFLKKHFYKDYTTLIGVVKKSGVFF